MSYEETPTPAELAAYIAYCLANAPDQLGIIRMRDVTVETKRPSKKRGAEAILAIEDDVIKALRNPPRNGPEVMIVVVPRAVCDRHESRERRRDTGLVLPDEVDSADEEITFVPRQRRPIVIKRGQPVWYDAETAPETHRTRPQDGLQGVRNGSAVDDTRKAHAGRLRAL